MSDGHQKTALASNLEEAMSDGCQDDGVGRVMYEV
jgi:hypothetical protein